MIDRNTANEEIKSVKARAFRLEITGRSGAAHILPVKEIPDYLPPGDYEVKLYVMRGEDFEDKPVYANRITIDAPPELPEEAQPMGISREFKELLLLRDQMTQQALTEQRAFFEQQMQNTRDFYSELGKKEKLLRAELHEERKELVRTYARQPQVLPPEKPADEESPIVAALSGFIEKNPEIVQALVMRFAGVSNNGGSESTEIPVTPD